MATVRALKAVDLRRLWDEPEPPPMILGTAAVTAAWLAERALRKIIRRRSGLRAEP